MALEVTKENFKELVLESANPVLVDFWAPWCGPCRMLGPIVEELAEDYKDKNVTIVKLNVEDSQEIAMEYKVRGIPCVVFFKDGVEVDDSRLVGVQPKGNYVDKLDSLLA
jgi:thioredoxin 1